jgi:hypothetical protein
MAESNREQLLKIFQKIGYVLYVVPKKKIFSQRKNKWRGRVGEMGRITHDQ